MLLLILSNFSFAASYMYCKMTKSSSTCMCEDEIKDKSEGISIDKKENSCCQKELKVLSNSTNLLSFISEINQNLLTGLINFNIAGSFLQLSSIHFSNNNSFYDRIPPTDITITTSSLQI